MQKFSQETRMYWRMLRQELFCAQIRTNWERGRIRAREYRRAKRMEEENQGAEVLQIDSNTGNGCSFDADSLLRPVVEGEGFSVFRDPLR